jgi:hypothetical protein
LNWKGTNTFIHGKYNQAEQSGTEKGETNRAQETDCGKTAEAPRLSSRIEEAQGKKAVARTVEAVKRA